MTNSIVIGSPKMQNDGTTSDRATTPQAMGPNTINLVAHSRGIQDFYIDNTSLRNRMQTEVPKIGNSSGGFEIVTRNYLSDTSSTNYVGDISEVKINGKSLKDIIRSIVQEEMSKSN